MSRSDKVNCSTYGLQAEAFVCEHIAGSLTTGIPVGFHWPADFVGPYPDAWCSECEEARLSAGGKWIPELDAKLNVKLLCGSCYDYAKSLCDHGRKLFQ